MHRSLSQIKPGAREVLAELVGGLSPWPGFVFGPVGSGKTCLALGLHDCVGGIYLDLERAVDEVLDDGPAFYDEVERAPLLVIDEIGARKVTPELHFMVMLRLTSIREMAAGPALYLSNVGPKAIAQLFDQRVADRVLAGVAFDTATDKRLTIAGTSRRFQP